MSTCRFGSRFKQSLHWRRLAIAGMAKVKASDGDITRGLKLRTKYSLGIRRFRWDELGTHPDNRNGLYPQGSVVKSLGETVFKNGFSADEVRHALVGVLPIPAGVTIPEALKSDPTIYHCQRLLQYNKMQTDRDPLLARAFDKHLTVGVGLLSHNHIALVGHACNNAVVWYADEASIGASELPWFSDAKGVLSVSAIAGDDNGKELDELLQNGINVEILDWRIMLEEPGGCACISAALNKPNEATCDSDPVSVMREAQRAMIINIKHENGTNNVDYVTLRTQLRHTLGELVDGDEFLKACHFVFSMYDSHGYKHLEYFFEWAQYCVNGKKRTLPLRAFAGLSHISGKYKFLAIAILQRAYTKAPHYGQCPTPEVAWLSMPGIHMRRTNTSGATHIII